MPDTSTFGLCAAASLTHKSDNQDAFQVLPRLNRNALVVADGVGGLLYGGLAAHRAVTFVAGELSQQTKRTDYPALFADARHALLTEARANGHTGTEAAQYGTTLLVAEETADSIRLAYVGNGSIWHVRPQAIGEPERQLLPWSTVNYLNPHSRDVEGQESVYRLLVGNDQEEQALPTVIEITKDPEQGDIFVLCTDGIYSADQPTLGQNETGLWVRADPPALGLVAVLRRVLHHSRPTNSLLQEELESYLTSIKSQLDDDTTVGVLVTGRAMEFLSQSDSAAYVADR